MLTADDHLTLDAILRNEVDMAFRRRVRILLNYLELEDGQSVFDCGCGMGFYLMAMARLRRLTLVGLDDDEARLNWARREKVPASLVRGDLLNLPFPDEAFDRILFSEVLEHVEEDLGALRELRRVLKPGGILAISVPHADYPFLWDPINPLWLALGGKPIRRGPVAGIWSNHIRLYRPDELVSRVREAGLEVEVVEEATHYCFPLMHFLVYGIGKPLFESNLLPPAMQQSVDRFGGMQNRGSVRNPLNLVRGIFRAIDRLNDQPRVAASKTFVNVLLKARNPEAS